MGRLASGTVLFLLVVPALLTSFAQSTSVLGEPSYVGGLPRTSCYNVTHELRSWGWNLTDSTGTKTYAVDEVRGCTWNCTNSRCNGEDMDADMTVAGFTTLVGILMFAAAVAMGMPFEEKMPTFSLRTALRYIFFVVSIYTISLAAGHFHAISKVYAASQAAFSTSQTMTMVLVIVDLLVMFIFALELLRVALTFMGRSNDLRFGEGT